MLLQLTYQEALAACFIEGIIFIIISLTGASGPLMGTTPATFPHFCVRIAWWAAQELHRSTVLWLWSDRQPPRHCRRRLLALEQSLVLTTNKQLTLHTSGHSPYTGVRGRLVSLVPKSIMLATAGGIGLFLAL